MCRCWPVTTSTGWPISGRWAVWPTRRRGAVDVIATGAAPTAVHPELAAVGQHVGIDRAVPSWSGCRAAICSPMHRRSPSSSGSDRPIAASRSLPLQYSFGLSVLHSHLAAGAGMVLTDASVVDRVLPTPS